MSYNFNINDGDEVTFVGTDDRSPLEKGKKYTVDEIAENKSVLRLKGFDGEYFVNTGFEKNLTEREKALNELKNMSDKDKADFYKNEMEIQVKIVFEVARERNALKKELQVWKDGCGHPIGSVVNNNGKVTCNKCNKIIR